jgi:arylsulfatase
MSTVVTLATAAERPNIVFIIADDTGYGDISAHGNPILKTPHLDRLHQGAVRFTDFHVSPTCAPTRSALMTGRHEFKNGVTHTILERERLTLNSVTVAEVLKTQGYTNGIFGKWHLGDEPDHWPTKRGFDEMFIHGAGGIGQTYAGSCGDAPGNKYFDPAILHNGVFEKTKGFCTDIFTNQAIKWMESVKGKQPFFCYIPYNAAHDPVSCPPKYKKPYENRVDDHLATFFGMIANIDENVGKVMDKLDEWGLTNDTLVIYMNDNGGHPPSAKIFNAGLRGTKNTPWEGGTRAASFWRWPGHIVPRDVSVLSSNIDFFPTLAELTGATLSEKAKAQIEGRSLAPFLMGKEIPWPDRNIVTHIGRWPKGADVDLYKYRGCSIRRGTWHMVSPGTERDKNGAQASWQLFDLKSDPGEQHNVAAEQPEVIAKLNAEYNLWWTSIKPMLINENAKGPAVNPFKELYWKQFGGFPKTKQETAPKS